MEEIKSKKIAAALTTLFTVIIIGALILPFLPGLLMYLGVNNSVIVHPIDHQINSVQLDKFSIQDQEVNVSINSEISNPNFFPAKAGKIAYTVYVQGEKFSETTSKNLGTIEAGGSKYINTDVSQPVVEALDTVGSVARDIGAKNQTPSIRVVGNLSNNIGPYNYSLRMNKSLSEIS